MPYSFAQNRNYPMTMVVCCDLNCNDTSNTFNNNVSAVYNVNLTGKYMVRIVRVEVIRPTTTIPLMISLISPVFYQDRGNYQYPVFCIPTNDINNPSDTSLSTISLGLDTEYVYNFTGTMELYINDMYNGLVSSQTLFQIDNPQKTNVIVISMEVMKLD